ncbi:unnamed protein product [Rotaria sordida]|uniref:Uncharacterized protein n=1 Tax=Rotaria sordida TaxID=392033 RepID=A0A814FJ83_9BILA|nr:unnamed protein product [Rotaria sordida]CAF1048562.1 unnamed protein product [Rotaria sordida]
MFCTVMSLLGMIEYFLVRYCTTSISTPTDIHSTKKHILKLFVSCMAIGDLIHMFSFLNYHLTYGSSLQLSSIGNLYGSIGLFLARAVFLWLNYPNEKTKQKEK